jgi:Transposase and inactivated derivatives
VLQHPAQYARAIAPYAGYSSLDDADVAAHMDDVHFNPVKHGTVTAPGEWSYSTFRACVARGLYPEAWVGADVGDLEAGEPD